MNLPQIITGKNVVVAYNTGSGYTGVSTGAKIMIDNRSSKSPLMASNLSGGADRPQGIRELNGYFYAYGDLPPVWPNQLFDLSFTMDGVGAVQIASTSPAGAGVRCRGFELVVEPYTEQKKNAVYYVVHFGGAANDFSVGSVPSDSSAPKIYCTKSLGLSLSYWNPSTHALVWSSPCYVAGMQLKVMSLADPDWPSCVKGIAYHPSGTTDWSLKLGQRQNLWPLPVSPNPGANPMLTSQPAPSVPDTKPGSVNSSGDLAWPDLDSVNGVRISTQLNNDLSTLARWELLYGMLGQKQGLFDHESLKALTVDYLMEKCGSPPSRSADTGYDVGHILYTTGIATDGSGGTSTTYWPNSY
jgi:hypothetical protein